MKRSLFKLAFAVLLLCQLATHHVQAQTVLLQDDFQGGAAADWGSPSGFTTGSNVADAGPAGTGDHALNVEFSSRAVVLNSVQWAGDWTAQGFNEIQFDVLSPSSNGTDLTLWLGFVSGTVSAGSGDTYVSSQSQSVASDGEWHNVVFSVDAQGWDNAGGSDAEAALLAVSHLRILHNPNQDFLGSQGISSILLDNITALGVPEPTGALLAMIGLLSVSCGRRRRT